ncbi:MAG: hypothetical protein ACI9TP_001429 [Candidatus Azotimanducaceae bacterium]|jgi:hypothetical protein
MKLFTRVSRLKQVIGSAALRQDVLRTGRA